MYSTKDLVDDMNRRDFEAPVYGEETEPWRIYEDVFDAGIWPSSEELDADVDHQCCPTA